MKRTYLDSSVLITAYSAVDEEQSKKALSEIGNRVLLLSKAVEIEVLSKPRFNKQPDAIDFYERIFQAAEIIPFTEKTFDLAIILAAKYDVSPFDAIHLALAVQGGADEFLTFEKSTKPMFKVPDISVISLCG